jgi:uracil-DNA glycosylase
MTAIYHPSALLRDASKREDMLRDMWAIRHKLEDLGVAPQAQEDQTDGT